MPRRPIKHKLEAAVQRFLNANKTGTGFASAPLLNSFGLAVGADTAPVVEQPPFPFVLINVGTTADPDVPGVATFRLEITLHTDTATTGAARLSAIETLNELHELMLKPVDDNAAYSDANREGGAFLAFANKPASGTDTRDASAKPLHVYDLMPDSDPNQLAQAEHSWNDSLVYTGTAQTMDNHEDA